MVGSVDLELACEFAFVLENLHGFDDGVLIAGQGDAGGGILSGDLNPALEVFKVAELCRVFDSCTNSHH
jgi:hypothetical protein